jgi:hypothetical protein
MKSAGKYRNRVLLLGRSHRREDVSFSSNSHIRNQFSALEWNTDSLDYIENCLPTSDLEVGNFTILNEDRIILESTELIPGSYISEFGFVPIVVYYSGDPYVLDVVSGKVFGIGHGKYETNGISAGWNSSFTKLLPRIPINRQSIIDTAESSFENLFEFFDYLESCVRESE